MSFVCNIYDVLDNSSVDGESSDTDENFESDENFDSDNECVTKAEISVSLDSFESKPTHVKRFSFKKKFNYKSREYLSNTKIHDELKNIPKDFEKAKKQKQNLTLKQILVLMNLEAIPYSSYNQIHEHIQTKFRRRRVGVRHYSKLFYVSFYNWYDLELIEKMINKYLFEYD